MAGSKIKVVLFGVEVETTLSELQSATTEYLGRKLTPKQSNLLKSLYQEGERLLGSNQLSSEERQEVRSLRNASLIRTLPEDAHLADAKSLRLTALGDFLMRDSSS